MFSSLILNKELIANREHVKTASIGFFDLSPQAEQSFRAAGLHTVNDLINCSYSQIQNLPWVGERTLIKIAKILYSTHLIDKSHPLITLLSKSFEKSLLQSKKRTKHNHNDEDELLWHLIQTEKALSQNDETNNKTVSNMSTNDSMSENNNDGIDVYLCFSDDKKDRESLYWYEGVIIKSVLLKMEEALRKLRRCRSTHSSSFQSAIDGLQQCYKALDNFLHVAVKGEVSVKGENENDPSPPTSK